MSNTVRIVSIDVGLRTCSLCVEEYDIIKGKSLKSPINKYDTNGVASQEMTEYLQKMALCGTTRYLEKMDLGDKKMYFSGVVFLNIIDWMSRLKTQGTFDDVEVVIIEKQMNKNSIALAIMYHIQAWFYNEYRNFKTILLYPSKNKTRVFGAPLRLESEKNKRGRRVNTRERKVWSVHTVDCILKGRKDDNYYNFIFVQNKSKKDDLSDTIVQCISYFILNINKF
jgi:hypothetical protein